MESYRNPSLFNTIFIPTTPQNTTSHYNKVRQRQGQIGKNRLWIDEDDWRGDGVLRKSPKVDTDNTIPERMS
jgi:hypothetical protein